MASYQQLQGKNVRASIALIGVISSLTLVGGYLIGKFLFGADNPNAPYIGLGIAGAIAIIQALVAWFGGADLVLSIHKAKEITADNMEYRQVYNIVEEMRIASGLPMPRVYIIPDPSPNAFATGKNPEDGRVAVTVGLLQMLNREELQGVIAHELAHIKNRDILFQTVVGIMVGMIVILADIAMHSLFWGGGRRDSDSKGHALMMVLAIAFAILAPIFATMIQFAISRQREYLADATGAEFTRNPEGLASALAKISGNPESLSSANRGTAHMFIAPPVAAARGSKGSSLFSTHPPAQERINRLMQLGQKFGGRN